MQAGLVKMFRSLTPRRVSYSFAKLYNEVRVTRFCE